MVILGIIALLLLIGCIVLALMWNASEKQCCDLRNEVGWLKDDIEDQTKKIDDLVISRDHYASEATTAIDASGAYRKEYSRMVKEKEELTKQNKALKADADAETAMCRSLAAQVDTLQQELSDVHAKATDLIERLDTAKKACEHPYGGRATADAE